MKPNTLLTIALSSAVLVLIASDGSVVGDSFGLFFGAISAISGYMFFNQKEIKGNK